MQLRTLDREQLLEVATRCWSCAPDEPTAIAEALRAELQARGVVTRRALCVRVVALLEPVRQIELDAVHEVLAEQEACGDVTVGDGGCLAAAPLRAVRVGDTTLLLAGGPGTASLQKQLGHPLAPKVGLRRVEAAGEAFGQLCAAVVAAGGAILTPERWAGLDRTPPADGAWLEALDLDLGDAASRSRVADAEGGDWRYYAAELPTAEDQARWTRPKQGSRGRLWRARHDRGDWIHAWTGGEHPERGPYLRLPADHAHRARFALARAAGHPVPVRVTREEQLVRLDASSLLPAAEYRFLLTLGERAPGPGLSYRFTRSVWPQVATMLTTRLGVLLPEPEDAR